jgi:flavin reductase (DIM6/NTAB) family NADH-FMN oxidoreductase RutF
MSLSCRKTQDSEQLLVGDTPLDPERFRQIMRNLAGAVCVVSTSGARGTHGLAATAVCSVCAEPPTLLAIVNQSSRTHPHIRQNRTFSINILSEKQLSIAMLMSSKSNNQFTQVQHKVAEGGNIQIDEALSQLHCRVVAEHDIGTHTVFVGRILSGTIGAGKPLVYFNGEFETLKPL